MSLKLRRRRVHLTEPQTWPGRMKAQAMRAADMVRPVASNARESAYTRFVDARIWAAPKLDHAAHSVEDQLAPRVSSWLSHTARMVEPTQVRVRRTAWPLIVLACGIAAGAAGIAMYRRNAQHWAEVMKTSAEEPSGRVSPTTEPSGERMSTRPGETAAKKR